MNSHYIKVPNGDLYNLDNIFWIEVEEHTDDQWDHCVWIRTANSDYDPKNKRNFFPSNAICWGSEEYCEDVKSQIEKLLEEHNKLTIIKGEDTVLEVSNEKEPESEPEPEPTPVPEWFRNLPPNEEEPDDDIQL